MEAYAVGHATLSNAPAINTDRCARRVSTDEKLSVVREVARRRLRHKIRLQQMDSWRGIPRRRAEDSARARWRTRTSISHASGLFRARHRSRQCAHLPGAMTLEGAPFLKPEHYARVRLRQSRGRLGKRYLRRVAHPHDGGGAALHLRRDSPRHQHPNDASIEDARRPIFCPGASRSRPRALSRRLQAIAAAILATDFRRGRRRDAPDDIEELVAGEQPGARAQVAERIVERIVHQGGARARKTCRTAARATSRRPPSAGTRSICTPANMKTRARRNFYRHAQGRRGLPQPDEQLRHRDSLGLQYGVPLEEYVDAFTFTRFEPSGPCRAMTRSNTRLDSRLCVPRTRPCPSRRNDLAQSRPRT